MTDDELEKAAKQNKPITFPKVILPKAWNGTKMHAIWESEGLCGNVIWSEVESEVEE